MCFVATPAKIPLERIAPRSPAGLDANRATVVTRWEGRMKRYVSAMLAYLIPTFALGFVWHLVLFESYYDCLLYTSPSPRDS